MPAETRYRLTPGAVVRPFDVSGAAPVFLVEGDGGRRWQVSAATAALLAQLGDGATLAEVRAPLARALGTAPEAAQLARWVETSLVAQGIVARADAPDMPDAPPRATLASLNARTTLLSERWAARLATPLAPLMTPRLFWAAAALVVAASAWAWGLAGGARALDPAALLSPLAIALFALTTVAHELGHVAAARRFGCAHGRVGAGVYLVFPVLFVELDDVWRLPRARRVVVDLAGLFCQQVAALAVLAAGRALGIRAASAAYALSAVTAVVNLNPAFRFDGYWLLADALGVANLRRRSGLALGALLRGAGRDSARHAGGAAPLGRGTTAAVVVYAIASGALLLLWLGRIVLRVPSFARDTYAVAIRAGQAPTVGLVLTLFVRGVALAAMLVALLALVRHAARRAAGLN
ncbi:ATPase involved in chromosome partitioning (plasmid) [Gemmatirosa kalamazoonensis]|uniref:ATPase involved in chromosome partitioning n=1 Tax=Gemmatirosa kalamazoonensis TaxID=861299 RepID=W0RTM6_9BACT|nr:hypothetical protein [Gemmatirosa kalamazoonensis]AHG93802.1 ATPase involved in chromosome partitioning [Gemmatirosa kalamazoonensis]